MVPFVRPRVAALVCGLLWAVFSATGAEAAVCGADAKANPIIFGCSPFAASCTITGGSAPAGCELDFGTRKVTFTSAFDVGNSNLIVRAGQIDVKGSVKARSDENKRGGTIRMFAVDSILVSGTIDVSGDSAG